jgi:membrane-associated phospholipid phosphatase
VIGWRTGGPPGLAWALLAVVFAGVVPGVVIRLGMARGSWPDPHVRTRQARLVVIPLVMVSVGGCIVLFALLGAPPVLVGALVAMMTVLVPLFLVTLAWKVSVHAAVGSGAVTAFAALLSPWWLLGFTAVAAVGWSRVVLREHTVAQTVVGALIGVASTSSAIFLLGRW